MNRRNQYSKQPDAPIGKFIGGAMGLIFAGVGLTVLFFLWSARTGEFDSPPLFFRVFGSFIALAFVLMGGGTFVATVAGTKIGSSVSNSINEAIERDEPSRADSISNSATSYVCTRCGAPLGKGAEVSPHGDVKCGYCSAWFNIYGK